MEHYWKQQEPTLSMTFFQEQHPTITCEYLYAWYLSRIDQIGDLKKLHVVRIMQFWQNIKHSKKIRQCMWKGPYIHEFFS
jgi:hypothetical protein